MKTRPYKGFEHLEGVRGVMTKRKGGISLLKEARMGLNRQVRRRSKVALSLCHRTFGEADQLRPWVLSAMKATWGELAGRRSIMRLAIFAVQSGTGVGEDTDSMQPGKRDLKIGMC